MSDERIEKLRALLEPREVKLHKIPAWLLKRLRAYKKENRLDFSSHPETLLRDVVDYQSEGGRGSGWLDHWGTSTIRDKSSFVSEPYGITPATANSVANFCKALGLKWEIDSNSYWNPRKYGSR